MSRECLTFVAEVGGSKGKVEMRCEDENIWLTRKMKATLCDVSVPAINQHLKRIFADNELAREATVKQYLIVQAEGSRKTRREVEHYTTPRASLKNIASCMTGCLKATSTGW